MLNKIELAIVLYNAFFLGFRTWTRDVLPGLSEAPSVFAIEVSIAVVHLAIVWKHMTGERYSTPDMSNDGSSAHLSPENHTEDQGEYGNVTKSGENRPAGL